MIEASSEARQETYFVGTYGYTPNSAFLTFDIKARIL